LSPLNALLALNPLRSLYARDVYPLRSVPDRESVFVRHPVCLAGSARRGQLAAVFNGAFELRTRAHFALDALYTLLSLYTLRTRRTRGTRRPRVTLDTLNSLNSLHALRTGGTRRSRIALRALDALNALRTLYARNLYPFGSVPNVKRLRRGIPIRVADRRIAG